MKRVLIALFIFWVLIGGSYCVIGQDPGIGERCLTTGLKVQKRIEADPAYAYFHRKHLVSLKNPTGQRNPGCQSGPLIIPVAVHFDEGIVPSGQESCAIDLILDQLDALNIEINGGDPQNTVYSTLQACFPGNPQIGEACISFCLAKYDHPAGYGLQPGSFAVTFGQIDFDMICPGSDYVPIDENWTSYLNIFITDLPGGLLGESAGIPGMFNGEGVVIDACAFGTGNSGCTGMNTSYSCGGIYAEGNTLIHEIGHYLGLYHIWGDNSFCTGFQDGIEDTPNMASGYAGYTNCNHTSCSDLPASCDSKDMYMNYMSYAGDACMYMFTSGQADLIHQLASNAGFSQQTPLKCITPEFPVATFNYEANPVVICSNLPFIHFFDTSTGPAESWSWTFEGCGVIPGNSSSKNPVVQVNSSGILLVSLTVSNYLGTSQAYEQQIPVEILSAEDPACVSCNYQLELYDSYGDGWNGAEVEIVLDGQSSSIYTINTGYDFEYNIVVASGQDLEVVFSGGLWDEEISFKLTDAMGVEIFQQGPNPPDGMLYAGKSNCSVCGYQFMDSGGLYGNYKNSETKSRTFCPPAYYDNVAVTFEFIDIELQQNCDADQLQIFNGTNEDEFLTGICGFGPEPEVVSTASNGCLNLVFTSDESVTRNGWIANLQCGHDCNVVANSADDGPNTLRSAIACATSGDTILIHPFLIGDTIIIETNPIIIDKTLTIIGQKDAFTINSEQVATLFHIAANGILRIEGMNILGQSGPGSPVILNLGQLILNNSSLQDTFSGESVSIMNLGTVQTEGVSSITKPN